MKKQLILPLLMTMLVTSCLPGSQGVSNSRTRSGATTSNSPNSVSPNFGRYFKDNPIILSNNTDFDKDNSLAPLLHPDQQFITKNQFLIAPCSSSSETIDQCLEVKENENETYISADENRWAFPVDSLNFLQVQTFGNMRDITNKFHKNLDWSYGISQGYGYQSAIPTQLYSSNDRAYWFKSGILKGYSNCGVENNAFYDPAGKSVCLGHVTTNPPIYMAEDPTITWHEMGHAFNQVNLNMRARAFESNIAVESALGYLFYDEAGSLNEGLADYYSQIMNDRAHFGEWGLGRYLIQSRPMSEDDPIHAPGIDTSVENRLSYPDYLTYDPNEADKPYEDVHYAGQIVSHFLTAFHKSLIDNSVCGLAPEVARQMGHLLIIETLSELGDQTSTGSGSLTTNPNNYKVNLDPSNAIEWISKNHIINYRSFIQVFSKYFLRTLGNPLFNMCGSREYSRDDYEKLVDSYGLLLFKTYNENGNGITSAHSGVNQAVTPTNAVKTSLISKDLIIIDDRQNAAAAFIIDEQVDIKGAIESLILSGQVTNISPQIDGNFAFNNGNAQISPGEVVGVALNLFNDSNSTMAGIQVLANDWDHTKNGKPCNNLGDQFPLDSEGAASLTSGEGIQGGCDYTTRYNGKNLGAEPNESLAPVCFAELADDEATKWVMQDRLRSSMGLDKNNCLGGADDTSDCFIRAIKGADTAYYSMIGAQETWAETLRTEEGVPTFSSSNVVFFEISPWISPGTTFNCRMRVRFTNCDDCYHDSDQSNDDYFDYEFAGHRPFKVINFKFTVID